MTLPRTLHRFYAWAFRYFWVPCPICGRHFGGHEWDWGNRDKPSVIPKPEGGGTAICPACTSAGYGKEPAPRIIPINLAAVGAEPPRVDDLVGIWQLHPPESSVPCTCCGTCACGRHGGERHNDKDWCSICVGRAHHGSESPKPSWRWLH
jgi:hypothetical protein